MERVVVVEPVTSTSEEGPSDSETPEAEQRLALGAVLGDKGPDSDDLLKYMASLKAEAVIPTKKNRNVQRPLNRELYKDSGNVERFSNCDAALSLDDGVTPVAAKRNFHSSVGPNANSR